jgi:hypothetical protein
MQKCARKVAPMIGGGVLGGRCYLPFAVELRKFYCVTTLEELSG